jgi:glycosyltransferase 2 family protein
LKKNLTNILKFLFFLSIGIFLVWLAVKDKTDAELTNIKLAMQGANYFWIILSIFVSGLSHYFRALRWKILLEPLGHNPSAKNTFFSVLVGYLANLALPRVGEMTRCGILARYEKIPFVEGFGTVIAERALDVVCVIILFFIMLGLEFKRIYGIADDLIFSRVAGKLDVLMQKQLFLIIAFSVILFSIALLIYFRKKIQSLMSGKVKSFLNGLWEGLISVKNVNRPKTFIAYTVLIWLMYILQVYVCYFAFEELTGLSFSSAIVIMVFGSLAVIFVPGGTGVYQLILIQILTTVYFISQPASFAFAWSVWTSQIFFILFAGLLSLILLPVLNKSSEVNPSEVEQVDQIL